MIKINECDVGHRCGNLVINYMLLHTCPNVILHVLRLCLRLATTADWAEQTRYRRLIRLFPPWVWTLACESMCCTLRMINGKAVLFGDFLITVDFLTKFAHALLLDISLHS